MLLILSTSCGRATRASSSACSPLAASATTRTRRLAQHRDERLKHRCRLHCNQHGRLDGRPRLDTHIPF